MLKTTIANLDLEMESKETNVQNSVITYMVNQHEPLRGKKMDDKAKNIKQSEHKNREFNIFMIQNYTKYLSDNQMTIVEKEKKANKTENKRSKKIFIREHGG